MPHDPKELQELKENADRIFPELTEIKEFLTQKLRPQNYILNDIVKNALDAMPMLKKAPENLLHIGTVEHLTFLRLTV